MPPEQEQMNPQTHHHHFALFIAIAILAVALIWLRVANNPEGDGSVNEIEDIWVGETLEGFPANTELTLPAGSTIVQSYRATSPQGQVQVTKILESELPLLDNFNHFLDLLSVEGSGWVVVGDAREGLTAEHGAIFAQNELGTLSINFNHDSETGKTTVDLSFLLGA